MGISYAGVDLLTEDPGGKYQRFLDERLPLEDVRLFGSHQEIHDGLARPRGNHLNRVGLPTFNWPAPPKMRLNRLWWPSTGATRWACGWFLASHDQLVAIRKNLDSDGGAELIIQEFPHRRRQFSATMYLLPPRILNDSPSSFQAAWLLPLVDVRYSWQFRNVGQLEVDGETTWDELIDALPVSLQHEEIPAGYAQPDVVELTRTWSSVGPLVDAIAACVGTMPVFDPGGTFKLMRPDESAEILQENNDGHIEQDRRGREVRSRGYEILAGGLARATETQRTIDIEAHNQAIIPYGVRVVFPVYKNGMPDPKGETYEVQTSTDTHLEDLDEIANKVHQGMERVFFDSAAADKTGDPTDPFNSTELTALAEQITADYVASLLKNFDVCMAGVRNWQPTGFDDGILYEAATRQPTHLGGEYQLQTRVWSLPFNHGVAELLHSAPESSSSSGSSSGSGSGSDGCDGLIIEIPTEFTGTMDEDCQITITPSKICRYCLPPGSRLIDCDGSEGSGSG